MKNIPLLVGTIVGTLILIVFMAVAFSNNAAEPIVDQAVLMEGARNVKGSDAPTVTVVEFADFQCPACKVAAPLTNELITQYPEDVQVVFRHYPLSQIHPLAQVAAAAAEVAADEGKFWEMKDILFETQQDWTDLSRDEFLERLGEYAEQLEIDKTELLERIESPEVQERVAADVRAGDQVQISGTPTFFVNGQRTSAPELLATVESLLN